LNGLSRTTLMTLPVILAALLISACSSDKPPQAMDLDLIKLPQGFSISIYADSLSGARSLARGDSGTVFVGTRGHGNVYAVRDLDGDHQADSSYLIASGLVNPNGIAWREGALYVAEVHRVLRYDSIESRLANPPDPVVVNGTFPTEMHHGWRFIGFGPDDKLYVPVGAPCNVCEREDERFATIMRMNPDGTDLEIYARGVRNTVGFDFHPETGELWFTDNGRDMMGDDLPPDELNHAPTAGLHFGFPFCHGQDIAEPDLDHKRSCEEFIPPVQDLGPHVAALGMCFYTGDAFPNGYRGHVFIAEHGSWNRTDPIGYRVTLVRLAGDQALSYEVFAEGWLRPDESVMGRPVDLLVLPDGSMLLSDDYADVVYRIAYEG